MLAVISNQIQQTKSAVTALEPTDLAIRILEQKMHDDIAGLENKVGLALNEIEKMVGNEKDDMESKVAIVNLLSNRIYQLESYPQTNGSHPSQGGRSRRPGTGSVRLFQLLNPYH